MPFKSEAQRRYLWANEPEIARDWTDTYGSKIHAADGGIMNTQRRRYFSGAYGQGAGDRGGNPHASRAQNVASGHVGGGDDARGQHIQNQIKTSIANLGAPPGQSTSTPHIPTQSKGFWGNLGTGIKDYVMGGGMWGAGLRGIQSLFTPRTEAQKVQANINKGYDVMNPAEMHGLATRRPPVLPSGGGDGQQQQYPPWWYDNAYAQNIVDDEELDIDTSTGDMEEWIQRFRVKDPYRQDRGGLDEQIKEYVSKLYT